MAASPIKLVCFDLDDTILNGHLHRSLENAGIAKGEAGPETIRNHVEAIGGIKNRLALRATMKDLLDHDVKIAITSYTGYPETIPVILGMIGLNEDEKAKVQCASFTPPCGPHGEKTPNYGKNHHIERAIRAFGGHIEPHEVVLVDDRLEHFALAKVHGYNVVWVQGSENDTGYLKELRELAGLSAERAPAPAPESWVDKVLAICGLQRTHMQAL